MRLILQFLKDLNKILQGIKGAVLFMNRFNRLVCPKEGIIKNLYNVCAE